MIDLAPDEIARLHDSIGLRIGSCILAKNVALVMAKIGSVRSQLNKIAEHAVA